MTSNGIKYESPILSANQFSNRLSNYTMRDYFTPMTIREADDRYVNRTGSTNPTMLSISGNIVNVSFIRKSRMPYWSYYMSGQGPPTSVSWIGNNPLYNAQFCSPNKIIMNNPINGQIRLTESGVYIQSFTSFSQINDGNGVLETLLYGNQTAYVRMIAGKAATNEFCSGYNSVGVFECNFNDYCGVYLPWQGQLHGNNSCQWSGAKIC